MIQERVIIYEDTDEMAGVDWKEIGDFGQKNRDRWVTEKAQTVSEGSAVLDVGAGTCPYRLLFDHCDYKTHDFEKYTGKKLGNTFKYGRIDYKSDITRIPVPDESFDVILCTEVLEHVCEPIQALREMSRILRPGGRIFITSPLSSGLHQMPYHFYGGFTPEWYTHFFPQFELQVIEILSNGGFLRSLAEDCTRVWRFSSRYQFLDKGDVECIRYLFGRWLPWFLHKLEDKCFIGQIVTGYLVEGKKKNDES